MLGELNHVITRAKADVTHAVSGGLADIEHAGDRVKADIEHALKDLPREIEAAIHETGQRIVQAAAQRGIAEALALLKTAVPVSLTLGIGPVALQWDDLTGRVGSVVRTLEGWQTSPPATRSQIVSLVKALAPDTVTVTYFDVSLALLIVQTDMLSLSLAGTYDVGEFVNRADALLASLAP